MHIIGSPLSGGAERFYMRLIEALHSAGHPVHAINRPNSVVARELPAEIAQTHIAMRNKWDPLSIWQIRKTVKHLNPDIVQTYMTRATALTRLATVPGTIHVARLGGYYKVDNFRHADAWIGNTRGICDYLMAEGLPADRVFYIGNFVDQARLLDDAGKHELRARLRIPEHARVIFSAGRLTGKKGFELLLASFARLVLQAGDYELRLVIAGDGPEMAALQQQAGKLGIADKVIFAGWQASPGDYYQLCDMFVSSAHHEPLGNVILEAWANATPVIATRTRGAEELISHGRNGLLVPLADAEGLAQAMMTFLDDTPSATDMAQSGFEKVGREFSREVIVRQYIDLYRQLMDGSVS